MVLHIGELIRKKLAELGMTKSEFARRINTSPQNVYGILKRESIDTTLLHRISKVLDFDFFMVIGKENPGFINEPEPDSNYPEKRSPSNLVQAYENCLKEIENLRKENQYLKEINDLLRERIGKTK